MLRAVVIDRGAQELKRLALGGSARQVALQESGRLVRIAVNASAQPFAADLGKPSVVVLRAVDPEAMDRVVEGGVVVVGSPALPN